MPARKTIPSPSDRGEGYWALLRAVPRTVARHGFRGLTYRALAAEAGVTSGLISYHFGSREALIEAAASLATDDAIRRSVTVSESAGLDRFAAGLSQLITEDRDAQAFQYELACEALRSPELLDGVQSLYERYIEATRRTLGELGIEADEALARVVFATLDGLALQHLIFEDTEQTDDSVRALRALLSAARDDA
jgi:AcrR family transcriptional regulator